MSMFRCGITVRTHEIDSTDVASVKASQKVFFIEDETIIMQSGRRCSNTSD